jgi:hypothetical protein
MNRVYEDVLTLCDKCCCEASTYNIIKLREYLHQYPILYRHALDYFTTRIQHEQPTNNFILDKSNYKCKNVSQWKDILSLLCETKPTILTCMYKTIGSFFIEFLRQCFHMKSISLLKLVTNDIPTYVLSHVQEQIALNTTLPCTPTVKIQNAEDHAVSREEVGQLLLSLIVDDENTNEFLTRCTEEPELFSQAISYIIHLMVRQHKFTVTFHRRTQRIFLIRIVFARKRTQLNSYTYSLMILSPETKTTPVRTTPYSTY